MAGMTDLLPSSVLIPSMILSSFEEIHGYVSISKI